MKKSPVIIRIVSLPILSFIFLAQSVYADCDIEHCGGNPVPTPDPNALIFYIGAGSVISSVVIFSVITLINIRKRNNR